MSDTDVCVTLRALENSIAHGYTDNYTSSYQDEQASYNGVSKQEWYDLIAYEWDRRGGTWKKWEGNQ